MAPTKCLVVDDHTVVRQGLDLLFGDSEEIGRASCRERVY